MTNTIVQYSYEGTPIFFSNQDGVMVNATQMAKPFGKKAVDFLKLQQTKEFLQVLSEVKKITSTDLVQVTHGNNGGTWMHEDVALEFARWLSPKFAIWCNDRIKELLTQGVATVSDDDETIARALSLLQNRLAASREKIAFQQRQLEIAAQTVRAQQDYINQLEPRAEYYSDVICSDSTYTFTQIASDLGFRSVHALMNALQEHHVVYKQSGQWLPAAKYNSFGICFATRTSRFVRRDGTVGTSLYTVVTEAGRAMLHDILDSTSRNTSSKKGGAE